MEMDRIISKTTAHTRGIVTTSVCVISRDACNMDKLNVILMNVLHNKDIVSTPIIIYLFFVCC